MSTKYLSCAETAKLLRQALKEAFGDVKFSVRSSCYSGGASIRVGWTDGPNDAQVSAITSNFAGANFDGMTDCRHTNYNMIGGEMVSFGANYVFTNRDHSDKAIQSAIDHVFSRYAGNFARDGIAKPQVADYSNGKLWSVRLSGLHSTSDYSQNVQSMIGKVLRKKSDRLMTANSPTAGAVVYLGESSSRFHVAG